MVFYKDIAQKLYNWYKSTGRLQGTDPADSNIELGESIFITDGKEDNYDASGTYRKKMYLGEDIIGDAYDPHVTKNVSASIGGLRPTTFNNLMMSTGGSISAVIDKILFATYAPVYNDPSYNINVADGGNVYYRVGEDVPDWTPYGIQTATCVNQGVNPIIIHGGEASVDIIASSKDPFGSAITSLLSNPLNVSGSTFIGVGETVISSSVKCAQGTNYIIDSDRNPCAKYALQKNTLIDDASLSTWLTNNGQGEDPDSRVLSARSGVGNIFRTYYSYWPVYVGGVTPAEITPKQSYDAYTGGGTVVSIPDQYMASVWVREGYTVSEMRQGCNDTSSFAFSNNLIDSGAFVNTGDTTTMTVAGNNVAYKRWTFVSQGAAANYLLKITKTN